MSSPVNTDDFVAGATEYLLDKHDVTQLLGVTDAGTPWLFQHSLIVAVEGSSSVAAVLSRAGSWTSANEYNTLRFPRLSVELWIDPIRTAEQDVIDVTEAWRRAEKVFKTFDRHLHRARGGVEWWGDVRTLSSSRQTEPTIYAVPNGDGMLRAQFFYAIEMG